MNRLNEGIWDISCAMDDAVRNERVAVIGNQGEQFAFIKRMTFYFVNLSSLKSSTEKHQYAAFCPHIALSVVQETL